MTAVISPAELVRDLLIRNGETAQLYTVIVGPATDAQQQAGVVSIMGAGLPLIERYIPLLWHRIQIRCLAGTLDEADTIAFLIQNDLHGKIRQLAYQASTDNWYLIHLINVTAGPSQHFDSPESWESLVFVEFMFANDPVGSGPTPP